MYSRTYGAQLESLKFEPSTELFLHITHMTHGIVGVLYYVLGVLLTSPLRQTQLRSHGVTGSRAHRLIGFHESLLCLLTLNLPFKSAELLSSGNAGDSTLDSEIINHYAPSPTCVYHIIPGKYQRRFHVLRLCRNATPSYHITPSGVAMHRQSLLYAQKLVLLSNNIPE